MKKLIIISCMTMIAFSANAYEYKSGRNNYNISGFGTFGTINSDSQDAVYVNDWRLRGQYEYEIADKQKLGLVYCVDALAEIENQPAHDAFIFGEDENLGRVEFGFTDSIATKLGVGIPDVGGLRLNNYPLLYDKIARSGGVISNTTTNSGRYRLRLNLATVRARPVQYGVSFSSFSNTYDYLTDFGIKYRMPYGKTKLALSIGGSFIDNPNGFTEDIYLPATTANWRGQISSGLNLQYNSIIWGLSARAIYDDSPIGVPSDGITAGTGISYDLLKYSVSASYVFSDTGIWDSDIDDYNAHTGILSLRYKYSKYLDLWISCGATTGTPFIGAGMRVLF